MTVRARTVSSELPAPRAGQGLTNKMRHLEEGAARQADIFLWWRAEWVAVPGGASGGWRDPPVFRVGSVPGGVSGGLRSRRCLTRNARSLAEPRVVTTTRRCLTRIICVRPLP